MKNKSAFQSRYRRTTSLHKLKYNRGIRKYIVRNLFVWDVTKTGNGEWGMGNGEWEMGNGKLKMGN